MKHKEQSHVDEQILAQTGGYVMVDYFLLKDGTQLGITNESILLSAHDLINGEDDLPYEGYAYIYEYGIPEEEITYPEPTAHDRLLGETDLTGWYIASHETLSDDGIVYYDRITMRNGIVIVIDDAQITVFESSDEAKVIGQLDRP